tara:strand:+ start:135 stop:446 length:312 start_codon:yes stop_codon:yes gene_type:complete
MVILVERLLQFQHKHIQLQLVLGVMEEKQVNLQPFQVVQEQRQLMVLTQFLQLLQVQVGDVELNLKTILQHQQLEVVQQIQEDQEEVKVGINQDVVPLETHRL